jgi:two-component system NtrC family sensor kinase
MADQASIDLLLTDVVMPAASGPELARRIRARHTHLPVVFMSGFTGHSAIAETDGAPLVQKPFTPDGLVRTVRAVLEARAEVP